MRYSKFVLCAPIALMALLAGCVSLGPDFESPDWDGPEAWSATNAPVASPLPSGAPWWSVFNDPVLDTLETLLIEQNPSLAAAIARLDASAAALGIARAAYAPSVGLSAAAVYDRQTGEAHAAGAKFPENPDWLFSPGAAFQWELDFWGRVRRNVEAASADFAAAEQNVRDARRLLAATFPAGYAAEWGGEAESSGNANASLFAKVPGIIAVMFLITVFLFNSIRKPLVIFCTVPLILVGVVAGLLGFSQPFGFMALLGLLSLIGMQIKNAIVLIDEINARLAAGDAPLDAVLSAGVSRLRPLGLAAATTVLGMLPLVTDPFYAAMSVTVMCGLAFATVLTLVVIPVIYALFFRLPNSF